MRNACFVFLALTLSHAAFANPFWCPPGEEMNIRHELAVDQLRNQIPSELSEAEVYQFVGTRLKKTIQSVRQANPVGAFDEDAIQKFDETLDAITSNPQSHRYLEHVLFRFESLYGRDLTRASCEISSLQLEASQPVLAAVYYASHAINELGDIMANDDQNKAVALIAQREAEFNSWILGDGLPQWPWEMKINERRLSSDFDAPPPLTQLIFLRPSAGINLSYPSQSGADVVPAFAFEPIGFIRYRDHSYKTHRGVSLLVTLGSENGAGYGLAFRYNGWWAGYTIHSGDEADALYVGVDLHAVLQNKKKREGLKQEFIDDLVQRIGRSRFTR